MNNNENKLSFWHFFFLWAGAAISIAEIMTGGFIAPLGFKNGLIAILLGHFIGTALFVFGGIIGTRENMPAMVSTRISFGLYGTYLMSFLNILQLVGWTAVMIESCSESLNLISKSLWSIDNMTLWSILTGIIIIVWLAAGITGFKKINTASVFLLFLLTIVLGWIVFRNHNVFSAPAKADASFGMSLETVVTMPLSWLPLIADYTRFAKTEKQGAYGSFLGYFIGSSWMFIIGLGAALVSNNADPSAMMLAVHLGTIAFGIVVLSTVTTTFMDAYSAGVTFLNLFPKVKEKTAAVAMTVIGTFLALVFPLTNYQSFLYAIGSVFAPLFAVLISDYFILNNKKINDNILLNFGAVIVWVIGVILYYVFLNQNFILGATVPSMIITGLLYLISWRLTKSWNLKKKQNKSYAA